MARKAGKTPMRGSLKVNFDETGRVKTFEINGRAADLFYQGLMKMYDEKKVGVEAKCTGCGNVWMVGPGEVKSDDMPECPKCHCIGVATGRART